MTRTWSRGKVIAVSGAFAVVAVVAGLMLVALLRPAPESALPATPSPSATAGGAVIAVTTTADGSSTMAEIAVGAAGAGATDSIRIHPEKQSQEITGFGAAVTHSSAALLHAMPAERRADVLTELFHPDGPARLSVIRIPIGSSDFVDTEPFTFDDRPSGETDWELEHFSIDPDRRAMIPVLRQILAINPDVTVIASPWSPPAWLKEGESLEGGRLRDEEAAYDTYAAYLLRFIEEYRRAGIPIALMTVQNEPQLRHPDGYPGTDMPVWQQAKLIERLGAALRAAEVPTRILGFDHNWELSPGDAATTPEGEDPAYQYPADLLRTSAARWIEGIAFHCYSGSPDAMGRLSDEFPQVTIWVTECSGSSGPDDSAEQRFRDTLSWQASHLLIPALRNRATGILTWNLALDEDGGPHRGGCETCTGVITVHPDGAIGRNAEYYVLSHAARFVPAGSMRIASESEARGLEHVAFRTDEGSTTLIIWNEGETTRGVDVLLSGERTAVDVPARSLTTVEWSASVP